MKGIMPTPCVACPYKKDVASGVWAEDAAGGARIPIRRLTVQTIRPAADRSARRRFLFRRTAEVRTAKEIRRMKDPFNIELQFQEYAKRVALDLDTASPVQVIETRRAFFGAWGQLLILMRDEIGTLPDDEGIRILAKMIDDVGAFWRRQAGN